MATMYSLPAWASLLVSMVAGMCVIAQSIAVVYSFLRSHKGKPQRCLEDVFQIAVLGEVFILAYYAGVIRMGTVLGYVYVPQYALLRYVAFAVVSVLAVAALLSSKHVYPFVIVAAAAFTLPCVEELFEGIFFGIYIAVLLTFCAQAFHLIHLNRTEFETELSAFSVMSAVDALHSGVLFSEPSGYILLCNRRMRQLMLALTGRIYRNAEEFYNCISENQIDSDSERLSTQDANIYRLSDGGVWLFSRCDITDNDRRYVQISAADITEGWQATEQLRMQNAELSRRGEELKAMFADIRSRVREAEVLRMQSALHDLLGQRLALLLRALREGGEPDAGVLTAFADGIFAEMKARGGAVRSRMKTLKKLMGDIGVSLVINGDYPDMPSAQEVCADVITEAVTNSVRHGFASEVTVDMYKRGKTFIMSISNNGDCQSGVDIVEGSGIKTMHRKLAEIGGRLDIVTEPVFTLNITIPNEGEHR